MNINFAGGVSGLQPIFAALAVFVGLFQSAKATAVDAELLYLVDVTKSVTDEYFATMIESYALAFESSEVIDALLSGGIGSVAASVVFYGSRNEQTVGVGWMEISSEAEAIDFAAAIRGVEVPRPPNRSNNSAVADALDVATLHFGDEDELGGTGNGFESETQSVTVLADEIDAGSKPTKGSREATVQAARDASLESGLDVINAITIGSAGSVDDYFAENVIGGGSASSPGMVSNVTDFDQLEASLPSILVGQIAATVPEPSWWMTMGLAGMMVLRHRRR
jgi:hypothetical protein